MVAVGGSDFTRDIRFVSFVCESGRASAAAREQAKLFARAKRPFSSRWAGGTQDNLQPSFLLSYAQADKLLLFLPL